MSVLQTPQFSHLSTSFVREPPLRSSSSSSQPFLPPPPSSAGSISSSRPFTSGSLGSTRPLITRGSVNGDRASLSTPQFSYNYARIPTPQYQHPSREVGESNQHNQTKQQKMKGSGSILSMKKKGRKKGKKKGRRRRRQRQRERPEEDGMNSSSSSRIIAGGSAILHHGSGATAAAADKSGSSSYATTMSKEDLRDFHERGVLYDSNHPNKVVWGQRQRWLEASGPSPGPSTATASTKGLSTHKSQPSVVIGGGQGKNDVEWKIYRASFIPSAQDYMLADEWRRGVGGGRFSKSKPKEFLDWVKYYGSQLPAPGDYEVKSGTTVGGRFGASKPKNDVEWMIYRASALPGPGEYDSERSSMVVQNIVQKKGAILQGKIVQGNSRTVIPGNFTMFKSTTENPTGPTVCRTDSSMGNQIVSYQKSQPSYSFGSRTDAESIFGLPKPKTPRRVHYRKTNMYKEDHTLGYDPYIKRDPSLAISTSSVSSLRATASKDVLSHIPSRRKRHMKSKKGGGSISKTFVKQYKAVHKLSRPKHGAKILPTVGGYYPEHYAAMEKMTGESYYS